MLQLPGAMGIAMVNVWLRWSMDVPCGLAAQPDMVSLRHRLEEPNEIKKVPSCGQGGWAQEDLLCRFARVMLA